jgi:hypothetical protein
MADIEHVDGERYRVTNGKRIKLCHGTSTYNADGERPCNNAVLSGRNYCRFHGGKSLVGPAHPNFITGLNSTGYKRFSKVGQQLLTQIEELRNDPDLFSLKDDAAFITAIMDKRAEAASEGVGLEQYKKVQAAYQLAHSKLGSSDFIDSFEQIGDALNETLDMYAASRDVMELIDRRVGIVEAEQRMMHAKAYTLEVDQAFSFAMQLLEIVKDNVRNGDELVAIRTGVQKMLRVYKGDDQEDIQDAEIVNESA